MRRAVLWDSSAILALIDADDADHDPALETANELAAARRAAFVTNYVEAETHALLLRRVGRTIAREWLLRGGLPVVVALARDEQRARELIARHDDKDWSLCDAISFAVMEHRGVRMAFSFDRHFRQWGRAQIVGPPAG